MEQKLIIKLRDEEIMAAVNQLRDANINIQEVVREFLINYLIEEDAA